MHEHVRSINMIKFFLNKAWNLFRQNCYKVSILRVSYGDFDRK